MTDRNPRRLPHAGKRTRAVVREVAVYLPRFAEVVRPLDKHRRRPKRLEAHDEMREVKLGLQVQLDRHFLASVLRLPPSLAPVRPERRDNVLYMMAGPVVGARAVRATGVADEALVILILQVAHDTESFWVVQSAR